MRTSACSWIRKNCEVSSSRQLDETIAPRWRLPDPSGRRVIGESSIADRVCKSQQIVGTRPGLLFDGESDHFPTTGRGQSLRMGLAEVIAVRFDLVC
jgi:hypothetical protein